MGDVIETVAVLRRAVDPSRTSTLLIAIPNHNGFRFIPVYPVGTPKPEPTAWAYRIEGERLHLTPSLHCLDTGFHTDFNWSVKFAECPPNVAHAYDYLLKVNPGLKSEDVDKF